MKNVFKAILFFSGMVCILSACYDDKGIYNYEDINDIVISMPVQMLVQIPLVDSLLVEVSPEIIQLQQEGNENLTYRWTRRATVSMGPQQWDECGKERICRLWVKPSDQTNIILRLAVTDTIQNIVTYREITLKMVFPLSNTWFVLQNINNKTVLGCVDGQGPERIMVQDVYFEKTGQQLEGIPLRMVIHNSHIRPDQQYPNSANKESILQVFTTTDGWQLDGNNLSIRYPYNMLLIEKYNNPDKNYKPIYAASDCAGEVIIDNGVFWFAICNGQNVYYPVKLAPAAGDSYYATMASVINENICYVFDDKNKRFLYYSNSNLSLSWWEIKQIRGGAYQLYDVNMPANKAVMTGVGQNSDAPNIFNPDNIGHDKEVVYMGATTDTRATKSIAIARSGNTAHIYEFNIRGFTNSTTPRCSGYFTYTPVGDIKKCIFTSTSYFNRIFFYALGNTIYRVDLNRSVPSSVAIYKYPDASAKITALNFCSNRADIGYSVGEDKFVFENITKVLGVAVDKGNGESSILEIKLTGGGEVAKENEEPVVYEFGGFKNVVDIKFMYKK